VLDVGSAFIDGRAGVTGHQAEISPTISFDGRRPRPRAVEAVEKLMR
jgi:hypothetical protein